MVLSALDLAGPRRGISLETLSTPHLMLMACEDHPRKPSDLEGVVASPPVATAVAAVMALQEAAMAPAQVEEDMAHLAAEEATGHLQTEEATGRRHADMADP
jgi:hypothetical protein